MILHPIEVYVPVKNETGKEVLNKEVIHLNLNNLHFVVQKIFEKNYIYALDSVLINSTTWVTNLIDAGLIEFETPEGSKIYVNPTKILFILNPALMRYTLVFPNGSQFTVIETFGTLKQRLGIGESSYV